MEQDDHGGERVIKEEFMAGAAWTCARPHQRELGSVEQGWQMVDHQGEVRLRAQKHRAGIEAVDELDAHSCDDAVFYERLAVQRGRQSIWRLALRASSTGAAHAQCQQAA